MTTSGVVYEVVPPSCRPTSSKTVAVMTVNVPSQSRDTSPVSSGVRGLCRCRVK